MSNASRIIIALGSLLLISAYFLPFWEIYLIAPQYPEGLAMQIWLYKITGQVDIINGLNHYIGMKHIKAEMFPEFKYIIYIFAVYIITGLAVAGTGSRKLLLAFLILFAIGGTAALVDFYLWGYDYGHNLDPQAAIQVPGFSYQPPLLGHKKLLNFDAYSYPAIGGWIIVGIVLLFLLIWIIEQRRHRKLAKAIAYKKSSLTRNPAVLLLFSTAIMLGACTPEPEKIVSGKDACVECKMTITDPKFAAELLTKKGKVLKFDDAHCVANFLKRRGVELSNVHNILFVSYENPDEFIKVNEAEFVVSSKLKSPMGGNAAAFRGVAAAEQKSATVPHSKVTNWATLYNILIK